MADLLVMKQEFEQATNIYQHLIYNYSPHRKSLDAAYKIALINYKYKPELIATQDELASLLKIYTVYDENGPIEFGRHGSLHDGGYVIPLKALKEADVLMGYGIDNDNSFEDLFSLNYKKPSYGFDCGITTIKGKSDLFHFVDECIANDNFLYNHQNSNKKITTFNTQIENQKLQNKKVFIKMDIEGAEYDAFSDIIQHSANITGIALEMHFQDLPAMKKAVSLLKDLDQDFLLVHVHGNNYCRQSFNSCNAKGAIPNVIELSFINKSLVKNYHLSKNQKHPTALDNPNMQYKADSVFEILV